jgi:kinesin family member 6/9
VEYKTQTEEGRGLEGAIVQYREEVKHKKNAVKTLTMQINATKQEMDRVQERLGQKQEEKRAANARGEEFGFEDDGAGGNEMVIDEEELTLLREMKDLKRNYRDTYEKLRQVKTQIADSQSNIDNMKQQIVVDFERWYTDEFDVPMNGGDHTFNVSTVLTNKIDTH